ncbi:MAG: hypothetical protein HC801_13335 [Nitrospira sp.]|nr:hypothetical protein [Nitrospira sp.]
MAFERLFREHYRPLCAFARQYLKDPELSEDLVQDLYFRLNVIQLVLPPLRDRGDDVVLLADAFVRTSPRRIDSRCRRLPPR